MKLTILGTGNATVTECYNTCFALSEEGKHFLVDCGGGNRILKVLKETKISLEDVHDIFITHEHADHILGIVWMIRLIGTKMNQGNYEGNLRIYCHSDLVNTIQTLSKLTTQKKVCKHFDKKNFIHSIGARRSAYNSWEKSDFLRYYVNKSKTVWIHDEYRWKEIYMCWR